MRLPQRLITANSRAPVLIALRHKIAECAKEVPRRSCSGITGIGFVVLTVIAIALGRRAAES